MWLPVSRVRRRMLLRGFLLERSLVVTLYAVGTDKGRAVTTTDLISRALRESFDWRKRARGDQTWTSPASPHR